MTGTRRRVDPEDGMGEVFELWSAETAHDLHRILALYPPIRPSADAHEPFALLQKHHETESSTSAVTAMLLLTDRRWRGGVGKLVHRIAESDILDEEQLDLFAQTFSPPTMRSTGRSPTSGLVRRSSSSTSVTT